jgi:hypothetical protein
MYGGYGANKTFSVEESEPDGKYCMIALHIKGV